MFADKFLAQGNLFTPTVLQLFGREAFGAHNAKCLTISSAEFLHEMMAAKLLVSVYLCLLYIGLVKVFILDL